MPVYEYRCESCNKVHEILQKFSDAPLGACPDCQGPVEKLMSLSGFALKGSGWYTTDYKRASSSPSSAAESKKTDGVESSCSPAGCDKPACGSAS